jgi:hypothetical protein
MNYSSIPLLGNENPETPHKAAQAASTKQRGKILRLITFIFAILISFTIGMHVATPSPWITKSLHAQRDSQVLLNGVLFIVPMAAYMTQAVISDIMPSFVQKLHAPNTHLLLIFDDKVAMDAFYYDFEYGLDAESVVNKVSGIVVGPGDGNLAIPVKIWKAIEMQRKVLRYRQFTLIIRRYRTYVALDTPVWFTKPIDANFNHRLQFDAHFSVVGSNAQSSHALSQKEFFRNRVSPVEFSTYFESFGAFSSLGSNVPFYRETDMDDFLHFLNLDAPFTVNVSAVFTPLDHHEVYVNWLSIYRDLNRIPLQSYGIDLIEHRTPEQIFDPNVWVRAAADVPLLWIHVATFWNLHRKTDGESMFTTRECLPEFRQFLDGLYMIDRTDRIYV